jgi:hypothetical protein
MNSTCLKRIAAAVAMLAGVGGAPAAYAQYIWLNEQGVKQFSDMPPPASVPKNRILKAPSDTPRLPSSASEAPADTTAANSDAKKDKGPMTIAEQNADFQKRKMEQADREKKAAEAERGAAEKSKNCERARTYSRSLESGERLATTDKNGERSYLSDQQRSQEIRETRRILDECK